MYDYDPLGRRIAKSKLNKQGEKQCHTQFIWAGSHLVQEILKGKNNEKTDRTFTYIYTHPDSYEPLAQCYKESENAQHTVNYFHCDQIGIPREMTDSQGKLIWKGRYDAWGQLIHDSNRHAQRTTHQPFRLQNQYFDQETGLHYNFLRYYEPALGRFITQDPIGLMGGMNLYSLARNTISYVDPLGLSPNNNVQFGDYYGASAAVANGNSTWQILSSTLDDMKRLDLVNTDQFFHCTAFCRVSKSNSPDKGLALMLGGMKEGLDFLQNLVGKYGRKKLTNSEMLEDMNKDMEVNKYGFKCPSNQTCAQRCEKYLDPNAHKTKEILKEKGYL